MFLILLISPEVYEARFAAALLLDEMRRPWPDVLDALSRLHEWRPTKADAIYYLGGMQRHPQRAHLTPNGDQRRSYFHTSIIPALGLCQEQLELIAIRPIQTFLDQH